MASYLDENGLRYLWTKLKTYISSLLSTKVDKVAGKGLSTNDFTTAYKNKLDGIANNANNYTLPIASDSTLGGVKVGSGLNIDKGILSAIGSELKADKISINFIDANRSYGGKYVLTVEFPFNIKYIFLSYNFGNMVNASFYLLTDFYFPGETFDFGYRSDYDNFVYSGECTVASDGSNMSFLFDNQSPNVQPVDIIIFG